jgi:hypothetical protein
MGDLQADTVSEVHCLECGATLPADARSCSICGNERLIFPSRWDPPGDEAKSDPVRSAWLGHESKILLGLAGALFCALALLGSAREGTAAKIAGDIEKGPSVVVSQAVLSEPSSSGEVAPLQEPVVTEIESLRAVAVLADSNGAFPEAAEAWARVAACPDAGFSDLVRLSQACERAGDPDGAVEALNRAVVRFPDKPDGYLALGGLRERMGDLNGARVQYNIGLSFCPGDSRLAQELARVERATSAGPGQNDTLGLMTIEGYPVPGSPESATQQPVARISAPSIREGEPVQPEVNEEGPVTLIGDGSGSRPGGTDLLGGDGSERIIDVQDLRVDATSDRVTIVLATSGPAEFSSRSATGPQRLIVRVSHARVSPGGGCPNGMALNVPLVSRIAVAKSSDSGEKTVLLVVYMADGARYTVGSDSSGIRITVTGGN